MRALSEISAMVQKAALGAGVPLGQADDLGGIAAFLAETGGDLQMVTDALADPIRELNLTWKVDRIILHSGPLVLAGPVIRDAFVKGVDQADLADIAQVPLITAILAQAGVEVAITGTTLIRSGQITTAARTDPVEVSDLIWNAWADLAAKTDVQESDASCRAGVRAGLSDND